MAAGLTPFKIIHRQGFCDLLSLTEVRGSIAFRLVTVPMGGAGVRVEPLRQ